MLEYIGYLEIFTGEGKTMLETDIKTWLAVSKAYEVLGEILKRLPERLLNQQAAVDWKAIKGFRDVLVHQYDSIRTERVWAALQDLPHLRTAVEAMLATLDTPTDAE